MQPSAGTRSFVAFRATMPQKQPGRLVEPPVCEPSESWNNPADMPAALPCRRKQSDQSVSQIPGKLWRGLRVFSSHLAGAARGVVGVPGVGGGAGLGARELRGHRLSEHERSSGLAPADGAVLDHVREDLWGQGAPAARRQAGGAEDILDAEQRAEERRAGGAAAPSPAAPP